MTTARKVEEPAASLTPDEKEDAKKFLVFLSILAIVAAIIAVARTRR